MSAPNLSLYNIKVELLELLRERENIAGAVDMTPEEIKQSLEVVDDRIREYVTREVEKVDGIAAYLRECEAHAAALRIEASRIIGHAKAWEARGERLESVTLGVMLKLEATQLDGATSTFKVHKNPPSLDVQNPAALPAEYRRIKVTLTAALWERALGALMATEKGAPIFQELINCNVSAPEAMMVEIKTELKNGGSVIGCRTIDDKVRLVVE
jgi:hypothetical protein